MPLAALRAPRKYDAGIAVTSASRPAIDLLEQCAAGRWRLVACPAPRAKVARTARQLLLGAGCTGRGRKGRRHGPRRTLHNLAEGHDRTNLGIGCVFPPRLPAQGPRQPAPGCLGGRRSVFQGVCLLALIGVLYRSHSVSHAQGAADPPVRLGTALENDPPLWLPHATQTRRLTAPSCLLLRQLLLHLYLLIGKPSTRVRASASRRAGPGRADRLGSCRRRGSYRLTSKTSPRRWAACYSTPFARGDGAGQRGRRRLRPFGLKPSSIGHEMAAACPGKHRRFVVAGLWSSRSCHVCLGLQRVHSRADASQPERSNRNAS